MVPDLLWLTLCPLKYKNIPFWRNLIWAFEKHPSLKKTLPRTELFPGRCSITIPRCDCSTLKPDTPLVIHLSFSVFDKPPCSYQGSLASASCLGNEVLSDPKWSWLHTLPDVQTPQYLAPRFSHISPEPMEMGTSRLAQVRSVVMTEQHKT